MSDDDILRKIREIFSTHFNIPPESVHPGSKLFDELGLDSLDAVDLVIELQELTGRRIKPDIFKSVRTVADVIKVVRDIQSDAEPAP